MHKTLEQRECVLPLSSAETRELLRLGYTGNRAIQWRRGRSAMRSLLGDVLGESADRVDTLTGSAGAPAFSGNTGLHASLSHLENLVCVAISTEPVAVDLCSFQQRSTAQRILYRAGVEAGSIDPVHQWVAIECAVKLRGGSVLDLLDTPVQINEAGGRFRVLGLGAAVCVTTESESSYLRGVAA